jgi:hypothetical protein
MTTYRAKLIVERVEVRRPIVRGTAAATEAVYDEIRLEVTSLSADIALSKVINLAMSEQTDREMRAEATKDVGMLRDEDEEDDE